MQTTSTPLEELRLQGTFRLFTSIDSFGELLLKGEQTLLRLPSLASLPPLDDKRFLHGVSFDHQKLTCIECMRNGYGRRWIKDSGERYYVDFFPHFVSIGNEHIDPDFPCIKSICLTVDDLSSLFHDLDTFGSIHVEKEQFRDVVSRVGESIPDDIGEWAHFAYYTGKLLVSEVNTELGNFTVRNYPAIGSGSPSGVSIENKMRISIEPSSLVTFDEAIDRMMVFVRFLSVLAGREQGVHDIEIETVTQKSKQKGQLSVYWCLSSKNTELTSHLKPDWRDVPINPIKHPQKFSSILKNWIAREQKWRTPRIRYINCLSHGSSYTVDRLVAAANMFDILPTEATPLPTDLSDDLARFQTECLAALRRLPPSQDRDRTIQDIKRIGKPSLPKKAHYRTSLVVTQFGPQLQELPAVIKTAIQCRNYFVHGGGPDGFNFQTLEPFTSFLTDALEFVFAASDLIEAGWNPALMGTGHGNGHSFPRFLMRFKPTLSEMQARGALRL